MSEERPDLEPCQNCFREIPSVAVSCRECGYEPRLQALEHLQLPLGAFLFVLVGTPIGTAIGSGIGLIIGLIGAVLFVTGMLILLLAAPRAFQRRPTSDPPAHK